ncbi:MAG TPA: M1 family aminopeptidase [Bacteroidales bacterium]|nr:M1 family aminopeptidase [Bacteroidales bacterium]
MSFYSWLCGFCHKDNVSILICQDTSNEFEEPWLDEGINSFWEERIVDHYYGNNSGLLDHPLLKISDISSARISYVNSPERQTISNIEYSWNYPHGTYGMMSYQKTAVILYTLMGIVREETTNDIFREYYKRWAFKHPSGRDFINVVNEVVTRNHGNKFGPDMNWFFDQTIYGTGICDYKVFDFSNRKQGQSSKNAEKSDSTDLILAASDSVYNAIKNVEKSDSIDLISATSDSVYKSIVELGRVGEVTLPVEVLVHFSNGDEILENWDGKSRFKDFTYTGNRTIQWVKIDPEFKIKMDVNYINNSMTADPDRIPVRRLSNKLLSFIQFLINFISL